MMLGKDGESMMTNPFECPDPSEPFSSTDPAICVYFSQGKVTFKDLLFVTRNGDGSHTDDGVLEVLQLEIHRLIPSSKHSLDVDFVVFFQYSNCLYCLPHCISALEISNYMSINVQQTTSVYLSKIKCA